MLGVKPACKTIALSTVLSLRPQGTLTLGEKICLELHAFLELESTSCSTSREHSNCKIVVIKKKLKKESASLKLEV